MNLSLNLRHNLPKYLTLLLLFFGWSINSNGQALASWTSATLNTNPSGTGTLNATSLATNVSSGVLSRSGLSAGTGSSRYNSTGWNSSSNYLQVVVTPATGGYTLNVSGKTFVFTCGSSNTGPSVLKLYSSVDNYAVALGTLNSSASSASTTITLPTNTSYAALSSITFRIKNESTVSANGGTVASGGTCGPTFLTVNGTVNAPTAPAVTTTRATALTANSISAGGNVTSNGGVTLTAKGVAWGIATNPTTLVSTAGTATGAYSTSITTLLPNTDYYYRAYASNSVGTNYGTNYDTTTLAALPGIVIDHNVPDPSGSIDFLIDENGNPDGVPATENTTLYAVFETNTSKWVQANGTLGTTVAWLSNAAMPQTISGLTTLTQYCFKVKARNANNKETALSGQVCLTTQDVIGDISDVANNTIADFCNGSANTFTFNYTSALSSGTYTAQLSNASGTFITPTSIGTGTSATSLQVTIPSGTTAGTGYKIRVINGSKISDTTAAFAIKAAPGGTLTTSTSLICPGQEATAKLTFNAGANSVGPFSLSIKNIPGNITVLYSDIVSGNAFDVNNMQLPVAGSNDYQLLQITSGNGCSTE